MRDLSQLTSWHADWRGLKVAVLGLGVTGFAAADTLLELGAEVLVVASKAADDQARILDVIGGRLVEQPDLTTPPDALVDFAPDLLVVSPGFHPDHPLLAWAQQRQLPVWGDIELAWRLRDKVRAAEWVTITGTNGKTTTTQLTTTMIAAAGRRVTWAGNIGVPVLDAIRDPEGFDVIVVELSSYQLHWINRNPGGEIRPWASVCLNLADDHYDWHGSAEAYRAAKAKVYDNTTVACVYNRADQATLRMVEEADVAEGARAIGFGLDVPGMSDFGIVEGILCDRAFLDDRRNSALELTTVAALRERGLGAPHSLQNVLAASALARSLDVPPDAIRAALAGFNVDRHRTELVAEAGDVSWVDDSKATNPHAANASLSAYPSVVWIVGGQLKGVDVDSLVAEHAGRLSAAVVIGVERSPLLAAFRRHAPALPVFEVDETDTSQVMPAAVRLSAAAASPGDVVLLAPAAASMDQFVDYADRGRRFAAAVREFLEGEANDRPSATDPDLRG